MDAIDYPYYLYHYTSIDTLALILQNRTIRFNNLCQMDDLTEEKSVDVQNFGRFVFISCWTDSPVESIPMWAIYSRRNPSDNGVRLKIRTFPFKEYGINGYALKKVDGSDEPILVEATRYTFYPLELVMNSYCPIPKQQTDLLLRVEYTDETQLLNPNIFEELDADGEQSVRINLGALGQYKPKSWDFQKEWRYRFAILPQQLSPQYVYATKEGIGLEPEEMVRKIRNADASLPFSYVDFTLDDLAFDNIEVTLSPMATQQEKARVDELLKANCPAGKIIQSALSGLIKI